MHPVVVVQHQESVPPGHVTGALIDEGIETVVLEAWHDAAWPEVGEIGALIVLGGTMNVDELETYSFLSRSRELMAAAMEAEIPTLGVCLGAQMMARVLGADVYRAEPRNAAFSALDVTPAGETDPMTQFFSTGSVLQFHEDTFELPSDVTLLATSSASGLNQAFRYRNNAYAIQFHFEVDRAIVERWIDDIGDDSLHAEWGISRAALMRQVDKHLDDQARAGHLLMKEFVSMIPSESRV